MSAMAMRSCFSFATRELGPWGPVCALGLILLLGCSNPLPEGTTGAGGATSAGGVAATGGLGSGGVAGTAATDCAAGPCPIPLVSGREGLGDIAVNSNGVYWTEVTSGDSTAAGQGNGRVMKAPLAGGEPITLASGQDTPEFLKVDARNVYWTTFWVNTNGPLDTKDGQSFVNRVPLDGGKTTTVFSTHLNPSIHSYTEYGDIAVDATSVYWACLGTWASQYYKDGFIMKVSLVDGSTTTLASGLSSPCSIAVDAKNVYWRSNCETGEDYSLMKVPLGGGPVTTFEVSPFRPGTIVLDAANVYWTDYFDGALVKMPLDGGTPIRLASGRTSLDGTVVVDSTSVYWTEGGGGTLMKVALAGGTPTTLATGQSIKTLAVDGTSVYWTSYAQGTVMKLTPK